MIYIIGGPARCGRTTLARMVRRQLGSQSMMADGMLTALMENMQEEWMPDLFYRAKELVYGNDPVDIKIANSRKRDAIVWKFLASYFRETEFSHDDTVVEGNIWADMCKNFSYPYKAVFLVDTSEDHYRRLIAIKNSDGHSNWMKDIDHEHIAKYAEFNVARSREHIEYCKKYGNLYFDIAEHGIKKAQQLALTELLR